MTTAVTQFQWDFPDGPKVCPVCGTATEVADQCVLLGRGCSTKGGGKSEWTTQKIRFCRPCEKASREKMEAEFAAGKFYDLKEMIAALRENREPRSDAELHPEQYPKIDRRKPC